MNPRHSMATLTKMTRRTTKSLAAGVLSAGLMTLGAPVFAGVAGTKSPVKDPAKTALRRELAGHLLRRAGFGPTPADLKKVSKKGGFDAWINQQMKPNNISDGASLNALPKPNPKKPGEDYDRIRAWYIRMASSKRQLLEKMTLLWHEHFATSNDKVGYGLFMSDQEDLLRQNALGNFRDLLVDITRDQAMLIWLDNNYNDGNSEDPPNENYGREFLQLFATGTTMLNRDGTPIVDGNGVPVPAYTENDIREIARALTGWYVPYPFKANNAKFAGYIHDEGDKSIMGQTLAGRTGDAGADEVEDVVDLVLSSRQTTVAAFISHELIQKLATETPTPRYVSDVAGVFIATNGDIAAVVKAILTDPEFVDPTVVRSQFKEPIEQYVGAVRALEGTTEGDALINWTYDAGQLLYYPPSVFSFYRPGEKGSLVTTATVFIRDQFADEFVRGYDDTTFDADALIKKHKLKTPDETVDYLADALLASPLQPEIRAQLVSYMSGVVDNDSVRGVVWLLLCSPDFQRN